MRFDAMKEFMDSLTNWKIPGNSICVYQHGQEIFSYQSGYANLEQKITMTPGHLINIYSCSKVATVTAALQLYEAGLFGLDDPVYSILPEYRELYVQSEKGVQKATKEMTIRHLFTMTSGLTYNTQTKCFDEAKRLTNGRMDTRTVIKCLAKEPLSFEPGTKWQYSLSHDVLACVVEVVSGERFQNYVTRHICEPLGIMEFTYHNEHVREQMAEQYNLVEHSNRNIVEEQAQGQNLLPQDAYVQNVGKDNSLIFGLEYDSGGAGITTSVREYAKFCGALANQGVGSTGESILSPETILLMRQDQLTKKQKQSFDWPHLKGYSYGLGVRTMVNKELSGSNGNLGECGWGGAAGATVLIDSKEGLAMFYSHHMLNPQETYYQPRLRNVLYDCMKQR